MPQYLLNQVPINYNITGQGKTVVLLHGFMQSLHIWDNLSIHLKQDFKILSIDLPGHGLTGCWREIHTMEFIFRK